MKYFGQFLVAEGVINEQQLVNMLIEQLRALPSYLEMASDMELLDPSQILKVIECQQIEGYDFKQACKKCGFWSDLIHEQMEKKLGQLRVPLGQLLLKNSLIDQSKLTKLLDDFFCQITEVPESRPVVNQVAPQNLETTSPPVSSEFIDFLSEARLENIDNLSQLLDGQNDLDMIRPILKELIVEIHSLKGVSMISQLPKTSGIAHLIEGKLTTAISELKQGSSGALHSLPETFKIFIQIVRVLRQSLQAGQQEEAIFATSELIQLTNNLNK